MTLRFHFRALPLRHSLPGPPTRRACLWFASLALGAALGGNAQEQRIDPGLIAHEWGTFTSIAGESGQAVEWFPLIGPTELPRFVEHFQTSGFKGGLRGTVRMETPVLYFYSTHDTTIDVRVSFFHGLITEWYPRASQIEPSPTLNNIALFQEQSSGSIAWDSVRVQPGAAPAFAREAAQSHYYAARSTSASPLRVSTRDGQQQEKFLFYRGVSSASPPLSALVLPNGQVEAMNQTEEQISDLILFERRDDEVGYRKLSDLRKGAVLDPPVFGASVDSLLPDLEASLVSAGLYQEEAQAMVESWKDSWFEEGSRLIYIVPRSFVDKILPLAIRPQPADIHRVFVGRMELVSPATRKAIETALDSLDRTMLAKYARFLAPIMETIIRNESDPARIARLREALSRLYGSYMAQGTAR
jgi:hypothetical protein